MQAQENKKQTQTFYKAQEIKIVHDLAYSHLLIIHPREVMLT